MLGIGEYFLDDKCRGLRRGDFEVIAESIPHIVWLAEANGSTDYFNERGTDYTGLPRQANYGWGWVELVHPDDAEQARLGWELATTTATPFELSYRIRRGDGVFRWHAFRALPVRGGRGEVTKWIGTADDVDAAVVPGDESARIERQTGELRALLEAIQPPGDPGFGFVEPDILRARVEAVLALIERASDAPTSVPGRGRAARPAADVDALSPREAAVIRLVAAGYTNAEMANRLGLSLRSIEASRSQLRRKLRVQTRAELVRFAYEAGLIDRNQ